MNRRQFIESHGATCTNWQWSWSFINDSKRLVIFGAWDVEREDKRTRIFSEDWRTNRQGHKNRGYDQSREHIRLIEEQGYSLMTFPMKHSPKNGDYQNGVAKIAAITPKLTEKTLVRVGTSWYASDSGGGSLLAEELGTPEKYPEGGRYTVTINAYERNSKARAACIAHHGCTCMVCGFNFNEIYGTIGQSYIHVHHVIPVGQIGERYEIDPVADLIPVCPNCHVMIHQTDPPLTVTQLRDHIREQSDRYPPHRRAKAARAKTNAASYAG